AWGAAPCGPVGAVLRVAAAAPVLRCLAQRVVAAVRHNLHGQERIDSVGQGVAVAVGDDDGVAALGGESDPESSVAAAGDGPGPDQGAAAGVGGDFGSVPADDSGILGGCAESCDDGRIGFAHGATLSALGGGVDIFPLAGGMVADGPGWDVEDGGKFGGAAVVGECSSDCVLEVGLGGGEGFLRGRVRGETVGDGDGGVLSNLDAFPFCITYSFPDLCCSSHAVILPSQET